MLVHGASGGVRTEKLFLADRRGALHTVMYLYQVHLDCRVLSSMCFFLKLIS